MNIISHHQRAHTHGCGAVQGYCRGERLRTEVGEVAAIKSLFKAFILALSHCSEVFTRCAAREVLVAVDGQIVFRAYVLSERAHALEQVISIYLIVKQNERTDVHSAHSRVYALVLAHIDLTQRNGKERFGGLEDLAHWAEVGEYRTVGTFTRVNKMQRYALSSLDRSSNAFKDCWIGSTHIGDAFYPVAHVIR